MFSKLNNVSYVQSLSCEPDVSELSVLLSKITRNNTFDILVDKKKLKTINCSVAMIVRKLPLSNAGLPVVGGRNATNKVFVMITLIKMFK